MYPVDSLQIYFPASLELQEELISYGFQVPKSRNGKVKTPIPLIYSNFRGWVREPEPVTIERLIPPEWLGFDPKYFGWIETRFKNKRAFRMPVEEVYVDIGYDDLRNVYLKLDVIKYHIERPSIREINPEKWKNWSIFYISSEYFNDLLRLLEELIGNSSLSSSTSRVKVKREDLQHGKEITYYAYAPGKEDVGIPVEDFSLCLGCFPLALKYFEVKAIENGLSPQIVNNVRFRLEYDREINVGLKVGVAKVLGKNPQIMFKLTSNSLKSIRGILKDRIEGKARGKLVHCDHKERVQYIVVNGELLYEALSVTRAYLDKLPSEEEHEKMLKKR